LLIGAPACVSLSPPIAEWLLHIASVTGNQMFGQPVFLVDK
jgi:hypothetical protein